jgi:peptidoglycan hydrolase CwlO-like protein
MKEIDKLVDDMSGVHKNEQEIFIMLQRINDKLDTIEKEIQGFKDENSKCRNEVYELKSIITVIKWVVVGLFIGATLNHFGLISLLFRTLIAM